MISVDRAELLPLASRFMMIRVLAATAAGLMAFSGTAAAYSAV